RSPGGTEARLDRVVQVAVPPAADTESEVEAGSDSEDDGDEMIGNYVKQGQPPSPESEKSYITIAKDGDGYEVRKSTDKSAGERFGLGKHTNNKKEGWCVDKHADGTLFIGLFVKNTLKSDVLVLPSNASPELRKSADSIEIHSQKQILENAQLMLTNMEKSRFNPQIERCLLRIKEHLSEASPSATSPQSEQAHNAPPESQSLVNASPTESKKSDEEDEAAKNRLLAEIKVASDLSEAFSIDLPQDQLDFLLDKKKGLNQFNLEIKDSFSDNVELQTEWKQGMKNVTEAIETVQSVVDEASRQLKDAIKESELVSSETMKFSFKDANDIRSSKRKLRKSREVRDELSLLVKSYNGLRNDLCDRAQKTLDAHKVFHTKSHKTFKKQEIEKLTTTLKRLQTSENSDSIMKNKSKLRESRETIESLEDMVKLFRESPSLKSNVEQAEKILSEHRVYHTSLFKHYGKLLSESDKPPEPNKRKVQTDAPPDNVVQIASHKAGLQKTPPSSEQTSDAAASAPSSAESPP
ncbi:MAG: hypothetical protein HRT71_13325, partial [Flavobacteriales bacterium]|nr:hypothetical protein [Flavobacteriales bacterium]